MTKQESIKTAILSLELGQKSFTHFRIFFPPADGRTDRRMDKLTNLHIEKRGETVFKGSGDNQQ